MVTSDANNQSDSRMLALQTAYNYFDELSLLLQDGAKTSDVTVQMLSNQLKQALEQVVIDDRIAFCEHMMVHIYALLMQFGHTFKESFATGLAAEPAQAEPAPDTSTAASSA